MTSTLTCKYHPSRTAMDKCEQCGAIICLECKKIRRVTHSTSSSSDDDSYTYTTKHILCPLCHYDNIVKAGTKGRYSLLVPIIFLLIFSVFALFLLIEILTFSPDIWLLFIPFFMIVLPIAVIIHLVREYFIVAPRAAEQARIERESFLREIGMEKEFAPRDDFRVESFEKSRKPYFCKTCGSRVSVDEIYCPQCGTSVV